MTRARFAFAALTAATAVSSTACFAVANLDRFNESTANLTGSQSLRFGVKAFSSHVNQYFEFRVVDANNFLRCRAIVEPLGGTTGAGSFFVRGAIPPVKDGPFRIDLFADKTGNRAFDGPGPDHSWRIANLVGDTLPGMNANDGIWDVEQEHNQSWVPLDIPRDTGLNAKIKFTNMDGYLDPAGGPGRRLEVRIADASSDNAVGFYRITNMKAGAFELEIPGVVDDRVSYNVFIYVDANGNNTYENPGRGADHGWRIPVTATAAGLELPFDPAQNPDRSTDLGGQ